MASMGSFDIKGLEKLQKEIDKLDKNTDDFIQECAKELAARLLRKVIKRTPVGDYSKEITVTAKRDSKNHKKGDTYTKKVNVGGKVGGTLRRGWTTSKSGSGSEGFKSHDVNQFVDTLKINHFGDTYVVEIANSVEYASYVEYGHRTANHKGWVPGQFMLEISVQEIQQSAPGILEKKIADFFRGTL